MEDITQEQRYIRAKKHVEDLKRYYCHLVVYLVVNIFSVSRKITRDIHRGETFEEAFFDWTNYGLAIMWGIPLAIHTLRIIGFDLFLGRNWEERKIQEFMNKN